MAYLDDISAIITSGTTEAGSGSNFPIFKGHMPDSTVLGDRAVAVFLTAGSPDLARVEIDNPGLQVLVRGASLHDVSTTYEEAELVAWAVKNALHEYNGQPATSGLNVVGVWNESGPFFLGFDASYRPRFTANLRVQRSRT